MTTLTHRPAAIYSSINHPHEQPQAPVSPKKRQRPLPTPPSVTREEDAKTQPPSRHQSTLRSVTASSPTLRYAIEEHLLSTSISDVDLHFRPEQILEHPRILSHMLQYLAWEDFHAFASTCRSFRQIVMHSSYRDMILSRFVPGYRYSLRFRDFHQYREVDIDMHDLALFGM